jgi:hypothetical protein
VIYDASCGRLILSWAGMRVCVRATVLGPSIWIQTCWGYLWAMKNVDRFVFKVLSFFIDRCCILLASSLIVGSFCVRRNLQFCLGRKIVVKNLSLHEAK